MDKLLQVLHRKHIRPLMEDKILFKGSRNNTFSVKIMYRVLIALLKWSFRLAQSGIQSSRPEWASSLGKAS